MGNETEENKTIFEKIKNLYGGNTYMGRYGIDVMKTILLIFLFILLYTYYFIQNNMLKIIFSILFDILLFINLILKSIYEFYKIYR